MPTRAEQLLTQLSAEANEIADAIEKRQGALHRSIALAERDLFDRFLSQIVGDLSFTGGIVDNSVPNLLILYRIDRVFDLWQSEVMNTEMRGFVASLFEIADMTGAYYKELAVESVLESIAANNTRLRAALGIAEDGAVVRGSLLWGIANTAPVRQEARTVLLSAIQSGQTLKQLTKTIREFAVGRPKEDGAVNKFFNSRASGYAYDLFNQVAEIKNEQYRDSLDLRFFIYVGDVIKDSRPFCVKKAGKVFATIEADTEWPDDPSLPGKKSGIPYTPRIDRGRWNCRHRIRYISREMAVQLDPAKVRQIEESYEL
jgi:hypothetical protein